MQSANPSDTLNNNGNITSPCFTPRTQTTIAIAVDPIQNQIYELYNMIGKVGNESPVNGNFGGVVQNQIPPAPGRQVVYN